MFSRCGHNADEIEPAWPVPCVVLGDPCPCGTQQTFLLDGIQSLVGLRHAVSGAGFHFDEDKISVILGHDVEFQMSAAPVPGKNAPAHAPKHGGCGIFAFCSRTGRGRRGAVALLRRSSQMTQQSVQHSQPCS